MKTRIPAPRQAALLMLALLVGPATTLRAATWDGGDGNWGDSNWDGGGGPPAAGADAIINSGTVTLSSATPQLGSLTLGANATLAFTNWTTCLNATNVTIQSGGSMTHAICDTNAAVSNTNRVYVSCSNLTVAAGGSINADHVGYRGGVSANKWGQGPGGAYQTYGGSYGGAGGAGRWGGTAGATYGVSNAPLEPGSGGGHWNSTANSGGGAVRIVATGRVMVEGTISANGDAYQFSQSGAGAGGGIFITCHTFAGSNGIVRANGGASGPSTSAGGGGGGGRIAVSYDPAAQGALNATAKPTVLFSANHGTGTRPALDPGTIYLTDAGFFPKTVMEGGRIVIPGFTAWSPASLSVTNGRLVLPPGLQLTVAADLTVTGPGELDTDASVTHVGGTCLLTNGGIYHVRGGVTSAAAPDYGALLSVTGDVEIAAQSWLYPYSHPTNGGSPLLRMQGLTISATNAGINADAWGYERVLGTQATGYGPGAGTVTYAGSYGGVGGSGRWGGSPGSTYGSSSTPIDPGSAGATWSTSRPGGHGGGLVRVEARGTVTVNGRISAQGQDIASEAGAGSGGGIYIRCRTLTGGADSVLSAKGGASSNNGGGGGGGRIALYRANDTFLGTVSAAGGTTASAPPPMAGTTGTVVRVDTGPACTNRPAASVTAYTADLVGELTATGAAPTQVYCYWGTTNGLADKDAWATNVSLGTRAVGWHTNHVTGLAAATLYFYRFYATNAFGDAWAAPSASFSTRGGIAVDNDGGATDLTPTSATLRGNVTAGSPTPTAYVCWGENNPGGTQTGNWDRVQAAGTQLGPFSIAVDNLLANQTYYYRCYATNVNADAWAPVAGNFTTLPPALSIGDAQVTEGHGGTAALQFSVSLSATSAVAVTVHFATSNGTAEAGADYVATNGVLTIVAGTVTGGVTVQVNGDTDDEYPSESLYVRLSAPTNAVLADGAAEGTILDDDVVSDTKTWSGNGNWNSGGNWSPPGKPGPTDDVIISSGSSCTLSNPTPALGSFVITNATLTFTNWTTCLNAVDVAIQSGGSMAHALCDTNAAVSNTNRVYVSCSNLTVAAGGHINADHVGYRGGVSANKWGQGPGGAYQTYGGSYGGAGGAGRWGGTAGATYGVSSAPLEPGSGGGHWNSTANSGGGAVRIVATGRVTVEGTISANGDAYQFSQSGAGAGGAIFITCHTFAGGNGTVRADGGASGPSSSAGGGGGGGRIAVVYNPTAQASLNATAKPTVLFSANHGAGTRPALDPGTVYLTDAGFFPKPVMEGGRILIPGFTAWSPATLSVTNGRLVLPAGLQLTVAADLTVTGPGELQTYASTVHIGGDATVTGGGIYHFYSGPTNGSSPDYGALLQVAGELAVEDASWIYPYSHPTNGGSPLFRIRDLTILSTNAGIAADARGFERVLGTQATGYGPGAGTVTYAGSYGGVGGAGRWGGTPGPTYGSSNAPVDPGSAGATWNTGRPGGDGGGLVRIEATGTVTLNGRISADGQDIGAEAGAGAGGGIYIRCRTFAGNANGLLSAAGGSSSSNGGGGGGGRIAVHRTGDTFMGTASAAGGTTAQPVPPADGTDGTVVWTLVPPSGTVVLIR